MKFVRAILNKSMDKIRNNIRSELGEDEIKKWHSKEQIKMIQAYDADDRRKCYTQKWRENDQKKAPDGWTKLERVQK